MGKGEGWEAKRDLQNYSHELTQWELGTRLSSVHPVKRSNTDG